MAGLGWWRTVRIKSTAAPSGTGRGSRPAGLRPVHSLLQTGRTVLGRTEEEQLCGLPLLKWSTANVNDDKFRMFLDPPHPGHNLFLPS